MRRWTLPAAVLGAALGVVAAAAVAVACVGVGALLSRQVLVTGATAEWATPTLATMLGVLGSLGPVGFYNETANGAVGLGLESALLPWVIVTLAPVAVAARLGHRSLERASAMVAFAGGYGLGVGVAVGLGSLWAMSVGPDLVLPVSPDLVAGRSAVIAFAAVAVLQLRHHCQPILTVTRPVLVGALSMVAMTLVVWLAGLAIALAQAPLSARPGLATAWSLAGANMTTAALFESVGVGPTLSVRSGLTGVVDEYSLAAVTSWPASVTALAGTAVVIIAVWLALLATVRADDGDLPAIWVVLGVAVGFAAAGTALASVASGGVDLIVLPLDPAQRSFSEVRLAVSAADVFTQLGSRALFAGLPLLWLSRSRSARATVDDGPFPDPTIPPVSVTP